MIVIVLCLTFSFLGGRLGGLGVSCGRLGWLLVRLECLCGRRGCLLVRLERPLGRVVGLTKIIDLP